MCKEMLYRHEYIPQTSSSNQESDVAATDIWDGEVYKKLKEQNIKISDKVLNAKYFSDSHDLALGLTTDRFAPWCK